MENPVPEFVDQVRREQAAGLTLDAAVLKVGIRNQALVKSVLTHIGSWPSSEPELAAAQRRFFG